MTTSMAPIGVVICTRNVASLVGGAIDSVLSQVPSGTDIVVVDAASTDGTVEAAASCGARVVQQRGSGLGEARNQGIAAVVGDIVAFCDADDRWTSQSLLERMELLSAGPHAAVIGMLERVAIDGVAATPSQAELIGQRLPGYTPSALLARRAVFDLVGPFDNDLRIGCDSDWFVRLRQAAVDLAVAPSTVVLKGARAASLSGEVATYRSELLQVARGFVNRRRANPE